MKELVYRHHAKWVQVFDETKPIFYRYQLKCSSCGTCNTYGMSRFCPHCGADMDLTAVCHDCGIKYHSSAFKIDGEVYCIDCYMRREREKKEKEEVTA